MSGRIPRIERVRRLQLRLATAAAARSGDSLRHAELLHARIAILAAELDEAGNSGTTASALQARDEMRRRLAGAGRASSEAVRQARLQFESHRCDEQMRSLDLERMARLQARMSDEHEPTALPWLGRRAAW